MGRLPGRLVPAALVAAAVAGAITCTPSAPDVCGVWGCPDAGEAPPPADGGMPEWCMAIEADQFEARAASAVCSFATRCLAAASIDGCTRAMNGRLFAGGTTLNLPAAYGASIRAGRIRYDPFKACLCLRALENAACEEDLNEVNALSYWQACRDGLTGTVVEGQPCIADLECRRGLTCVPDEPDTCMATCRKTGTGVCVTRQDCPEGNVCIQNRCAPMLALGDVCAGEPPARCPPGSRCVAGDDEQERCRKTGAEYEACADGDGAPCAPGLVCRETAGGARACLRPLQEGDKCRSLFECSGEHGPLACSLGGTCVQRRSSGDCINGEMGGCDLLVSYCDTSTGLAKCRPYKENGAQCTSDLECGGVLGPGIRCVVDEPDGGSADGGSADGGALPSDDGGFADGGVALPDGGGPDATDGGTWEAPDAGWPPRQGRCEVPPVTVCTPPR